MKRQVFRGKPDGFKGTWYPGTAESRRGFETVHKANDLGLEGCFRFRKEEN